MAHIKGIMKVLGFNTLDTEQGKLTETWGMVVAVKHTATTRYLDKVILQSIFKSKSWSMEIEYTVLIIYCNLQLLYIRTCMLQMFEWKKLLIYRFNRAP